MRISDPVQLGAVDKSEDMRQLMHILGLIHGYSLILIIHGLGVALNALTLYQIKMRWSVMVHKQACQIVNLVPNRNEVSRIGTEASASDWESCTKSE